MVSKIGNVTVAEHGSKEQFAVLPAGVTLDDPDSFAIVLQGDCMEPDFHDGDILVVSPKAPRRNGDPCIVLVPTNLSNAEGLKYFVMALKDVLRNANGDVFLMPKNPRYESKRYSRGQVHVVGKVVCKARARLATSATAAAAAVRRSRVTGRKMNRDGLARRR